MAGEEMQSFKGWRAEVGMLAPIPGMYREFDILAPDGVKFSRAILGMGDVTPEQLKKLADAIDTEAVKLNIACRKDLMCLGCTSGSFIGGPGYDQKVIEIIEKASDGVPATTTTTCVLELFKDMGIKKIALVGPYIESIFDAEVEFFKANGVESLFVKGWGLLKISEYWDYYVDPYACYGIIKEGAKAAPNADCVFMTCMMSRIMGIADILEEEIGKPVISSCSATFYGILKKLGISDPIPHYGEALRRPRV